MAHPSLLPALRRAADGGDLICGAAADEIERLHAVLKRLACSEGNCACCQDFGDKPSIYCDKYRARVALEIP